jgi:hypothetical protein
MVEHVLEGTWEEVAKHAEEFVGKRVRLTVYEEEEKGTAQPLDRMLQGLIGTVKSNGGKGGSRFSESTGAEFAEGLQKKRDEGRL